MSIAAASSSARGNAEVLADNLHGERDWGFRAEPNPELNGRSLSMSMGKVLGGGSSVNANSSGYRDLALLGERFHVIEPERWNKMFSHQVSSAATPVSLESLAREKMSQNHITYDVSQSSWPTSVKIQTIRRSALAAVASGASRSIVD